MPCYSPLEGFLARSGGIAFDTKNGYVDVPMAVACGRCLGCRLDRRRDWAVRCMHEAQLHEHKWFCTFTYATLPENGSLFPQDFTRFLKRLRKTQSRLVWEPPRRLRVRRYEDIRYFQCGEYGDELERPHHHAIMFGLRLPDLRPLRKNDRGEQLYASAQLDRIWSHGYVQVGAVTFESAAYVAQYCTKKINGDAAKQHYTRILPSGEIVELEPEYATMSRNPAIGRRWIERYHADVYPSDFVVLNGSQQKPPRFYDKLFKKHRREQMRPIHLKRLAAGNTPRARRERTKERLAVRAEVKQAAITVKKRNLS